jgi:hypothetical protein
MNLQIQKKNLDDANNQQWVGMLGQKWKESSKKSGKNEGLNCRRREAEPCAMNMQIKKWI